MIFIYEEKAIQNICNESVRKMKNENGINDQETCLCLPFNLTISKTKVQKIQILNITANVVFIIM